VRQHVQSRLPPDDDPAHNASRPWVAVDLLRRVYQAPDRGTAHRRLAAFYEWAVTVEVAEVTRLARTIGTWQDEVLGFFDTRASNAPPSPPTSGSSRSAERPWVHGAGRARW
jgi:transposase